MAKSDTPSPTPAEFLLQISGCFALRFAESLHLVYGHAMPVLPPLPDLQRDFIAALKGYQVRFLIIGGRAVQANGVQERQTSDLDILLDPSPRSLEGLGKFFAKYVAKPPTGESDWASALGVKGRLYQYPDGAQKQVDILTSIDGIDYKDCLARAFDANFGRQVVKVACRNDVIRMKEISLSTTKSPAAKEQDLADIEALKNLSTP